MNIIKFIKDWTLPVAIAVGAVVYLVFYWVPQLDAAGDTLGEVVDTIFPMMVFSTLFSTFCRIDFHQMRPHRWHVGIIVTQLLLIALNVWVIFCVEGDLWQKILWESVLTCIIGSSGYCQDRWQHQYDDGFCRALVVCLVTDHSCCVPLVGTWCRPRLLECVPHHPAEVGYRTYSAVGIRLVYAAFCQEDMCVDSLNP